MAAAVPGPLLRAIAAARAWLDQLGVPSAVVGGIRGLLKTFTEALETDDFAAEFERILARARRPQR